MRSAQILFHGIPAGLLQEVEKKRSYRFLYLDEYTGPPVSLTLPVSGKEYLFDTFPPFFDGLLPEGIMLDGLLRRNKIDRDDLFGQLVTVGQDMVGAVTVRET